MAERRLVAPYIRVRLPVVQLAGWSSSVARRPHKPEVPGSNPDPATISRFAGDSTCWDSQAVGRRSAKPYRRVRLPFPVRMRLPAPSAITFICPFVHRQDGSLWCSRGWFDPIMGSASVAQQDQSARLRNGGSWVRIPLDAHRVHSGATGTGSPNGGNDGRHRLPAVR